MSCQSGLASQMVGGTAPAMRAAMGDLSVWSVRRSGMAHNVCGSSKVRRNWRELSGLIRHLLSCVKNCGSELVPLPRNQGNPLTSTLENTCCDGIACGFHALFVFVHGANTRERREGIAIYK